MDNKKLLLWSLPLLLLSMSAFADISIGGFKNSGHIETFIFPPHNEYDPNLGIPFPERVVARYGLEFYTKISHETILPALFAFIDSFSAFGNSHPNLDYNFKADPIVMILTLGAGYQLAEHAQVRVTTSQYINLGKYQSEGPPWTGLSFRWEW